MIYIDFDKSSSEPLYIQAFTQLSQKINRGELKNGTKLPSQRKLAQQLGISVNTVVNTYNILEQYGYISSRERSGYFVSDISVAAEIDKPERQWRSNTPCIYNFSRNGVDLSVPAAFKRTYRQCAKEFSENIVMYPDYNGNYDLRKHICLMLEKTQGIICDPIQVIIGADLSSLLSALIMVLSFDRPKIFAMENPAYSKIAHLAHQASWETRWLNIPKNGISSEILHGFDADVLFLMSFNHYPLYYHMSRDQKNAVLDWAGKDRYIIEYSYDMDYVYSDPSRPLYSMTENKNVIFAGDFKRTISPSINVAYFVLPEHLLNMWCARYDTYHSSVSPTDQMFVTEVIKNGSYYSNIARLRKLYRGKLELLKNTLKSHPCGDLIEILNSDCGTTLTLFPHTDVSEETLIDIAHENGVKLSYIKNSLECENKIIDKKIFMMGCGELSPSDIEAGANLLMNTWTELLHDRS